MSMPAFRSAAIQKNAYKTQKSLDARALPLYTHPRNHETVLATAAG